jgi:hypothetical protein
LLRTIVSIESARYLCGGEPTGFRGMAASRSVEGGNPEISSDSASVGSSMDGLIVLYDILISRGGVVLGRTTSGVDSMLPSPK